MGKVDVMSRIKNRDAGDSIKDGKWKNLQTYDWTLTKSHTSGLRNVMGQVNNCFSCNVSHSY